MRRVSVSEYTTHVYTLYIDQQFCALDQLDCIVTVGHCLIRSLLLAIHAQSLSRRRCAGLSSKWFVFPTWENEAGTDRKISKIEMENQMEGPEIML